MNENQYQIGIEAIKKFLPHRHPFLLVDRIDAVYPSGDVRDLDVQKMIGTRVVARKCVSFNEFHFTGHFPLFSIMPGVLIIEAMAQAASFSLYPYMKSYPPLLEKGVDCLLVGVDSTRFRRPVVPGDLLQIEAKVEKIKGKLWWFDCQATVEGQRVAEALVMANLQTDLKIPQIGCSASD